MPPSVTANGPSGLTPPVSQDRTTPLSDRGFFSKARTLAANKKADFQPKLDNFFNSMTNTREKVVNFAKAHPCLTNVGTTVLLSAAGPLGTGVGLATAVALTPEMRSSPAQLGASYGAAIGGFIGVVGPTAMLGASIGAAVGAVIGKSIEAFCSPAELNSEEAPAVDGDPGESNASSENSLMMQNLDEEVKTKIESSSPATLARINKLFSEGTISVDEVTRAIDVLESPIGQFTLTGSPAKALTAVNSDIGTDLGAGFTALHLASITGDTGLLDRAIEHFGTDGIDAKTEKNDFLDKILRIGNAPAANNDTALTISAYMGKDEAAKSLIEKGANIAHSNGTGNTPLHLAAGRCFGALEVLLPVLKDKDMLDINLQTDPGKSTPLHHAAKSNNQLAVALLLREGATESLDKADAGGITPRSILLDKNIPFN